METRQKMGLLYILLHSAFIHAISAGGYQLSSIIGSSTIHSNSESDLTVTDDDQEFLSSSWGTFDEEHESDKSDPGNNTFAHEAALNNISKSTTIDSDLYSRQLLVYGR